MKTMKNNTGTASEWTTKELQLFGLIKGQLREKKINQGKLAERLNVTQGHISQMLSGVRPMRVNQLLEILDELGLNIPQLNDEEGNKSGPDPERVIDMNLVQHREVFTEILQKLYEIDRAGDQPLNRVNAYLDGMIDLAKDEKKNQENKK